MDANAVRSVVTPRSVLARGGRVPRALTGTQARGFWLGLLGLAVLASGEEALSRSGVVSPVFFPPASVVVRRVGTLLLNEPFHTISASPSARPAWA